VPTALESLLRVPRSLSTKYHSSCCQLSFTALCVELNNKNCWFGVAGIICISPDSSSFSSTSAAKQFLNSCQITTL
jgi:hypothetical protein